MHSCYRGFLVIFLSRSTDLVTQTSIHCIMPGLSGVTQLPQTIKQGKKQALPKFIIDVSYCISPRLGNSVNWKVNTFSSVSASVAKSMSGVMTALARSLTVKPVLTIWGGLLSTGFRKIVNSCENNLSIRKARKKVRSISYWKRW